jgi:hypothetical protein
VIGIIGLIAFFLIRRSRANSRIPATSYPMAGPRDMNDSTAFVPLQHNNYSQVQDGNSYSFNEPYRDDHMAPRASEWR